VAVTLTLASTNKWIIVVALAASVPALVTQLWSARQWYRVEVENVWLARLRYYISNVIQSKSAAAEIRAFQAERVLEDWSFGALEIMQKSQGAARRRRSVLGLVASTAGGVVMACGAILSISASHGSTMANVITTVIGLAQLKVIFSQMFAKISSLADASLYLQNIRTLEEMSAGLRSIDTSSSPEDGEGLNSIRLSGVGYRYPGATRSAVSDISFSLGNGELIAVVGRNGSGKTTLAKIMAGLLEPTSGSITWNDKEYSQVGEAVRAGVTMQFQESEKWCFTVRENIWLGDVTREEMPDRVLSSVQSAGLEELVRSLPDGIETRLGKELGPGSDLSGGQWQRLAMARCFYRDSHLVILDEPTSSFDAIAEANFLRSIRELLKGRAGILITHRFSSLRQADKIIVLDDGRIVEEGRHEQLAESGGIYSDLYRKQIENLVDQRDEPVSIPREH
jgi:ATP-binding cassette subfamily B protein